MSRTKKSFYGIGAILVLLVSASFGAAFYLQYYALQARGNERGKDIAGSLRYMKETYPALAGWIDSINTPDILRDTFITADDGTRLHACYLQAPSPTLRTAVVVHGYTDNVVRMLHIGHLYNHRLGYNVLLPDLRYSGLSGGTHLQMGWNDRLDVMRWMDVANSRFGGTAQTRMVVHGISMGGATTLCVSGEQQKPYVKCFVDDCGFTSVWDEFESELQAQFGLPAFPLLYCSDLLTRWRYGWSFREASALRQVARSRLPILFIHGDSDTFVPTRMTDSLYAAKQGDKALWIAPSTTHAEAYRNYPDIYAEKIESFVSKYIR
ncbi:MAG: alpha/beta hydrolase [Paraprevotella sp.]|nr:alpha/beta hydrolase [Paraprevotella sp.]